MCCVFILQLNGLNYNRIYWHESIAGKAKKHKNNEMKGKNDAHAGPFDNIIYLTSETLLGKTYCHRIIIYLCSRIIRAYFFFFGFYSHSQFDTK